MPRHASRWEVTLTRSEVDALAAVENYVLTGYNVATSNRDNSLGFVMTTFQKLMASSIAALRASLAKRFRSMERLGIGSTVSAEEALEEDAPAADVVTRGRAMTGEREQLARLIALLDKVETDSKADVLLDQLDVVREQDANAKVLIFTEFRETQDYLAKRLAARGWGVNVFHGQMKIEGKDKAVEQFRDDEGSRVLVSTEAGGEGRNFQFCHLLVNYDLPWNPMRVEQRIGRVDRIGQENVVQVFNLWVRGTIEERILDVLERRINVFEQTVGGLDPILGETERDLRRILRQAGVERERALEQFEQDVERRVAKARRAERQLRDFVMDTKSFSREISERVLGQASPVSEEDRERLVRRLLASVRTYLHEFKDGEYELVFHEPFVSDYPEFVKDSGFALSRWWWPVEVNGLLSDPPVAGVPPVAVGRQGRRWALRMVAQLPCRQLLQRRKIGGRCERTTASRSQAVTISQVPDGPNRAPALRRALRERG
jgi:ATP-dependent helicase HepA